MILKKFVPLTLIAVFLLTTIRAQVTTNFNALRQAAQNAEKQHQELNIRLLRVAKQKGWPLSITLKNNHQAILYGINAKGIPLYVSTNENIISAATIGTNQLWPGGSTGLNLSGSTADMKGRIAIWDGGKVLSTHQELNGRVLQKDNATVLNDHSTHVTGTLIAAGVNPVAKGMSFGAQQLLAYDFNNHIAEMFAAAPGLLISNHSYGTLSGWNYNTDDNRWEFLGNPGDTVDYKFGYYDDQSAAWDSMAFHAPNYLIVKSVGNNRDINGPPVGDPYYRYNAQGQIVSAGKRPAGISNNDGFDIVPTYGTAKNILSVGAVYPIPGGYNSPSDVVLAEFSSWGPTDDGRIKPEVVADGINVLSSISTSNNAYAIYSGTSMSSPAAAGSSFLLQEYFYRLHNGYMHSATLKGILIHTADEAGPADGPDFQFGYGLIDMPKAAAVIQSNNTGGHLIQENVLNNGATYPLPVVASGKGPLVVTISWTDPAALTDEVNILNNPTPKLVNDLDVRVAGNGSTYMPWILNPLNPGNPASHGDDKLNNVEKIYIPDAVPGKTYNITVSHKGSLRNGSQAYSLIVSGVMTSPYCSSAATSSAGTRVDEVAIGNIDQVNPAGCTTYTDHTAQTIGLQAGQSVPFTIKLSSCDASSAQRIVKIFIDYNNNGNFDDPGETAAVSPVLAGGAVNYSGTINVATGTTVGNNTMMRIVAQETTDSTLVKACGTYPNGETEDFTVKFSPLTNDAAINAIVDPLPGACVVDSARFRSGSGMPGSVQQINLPIQLQVIAGNTTLISVNTVYPDTIAANSSAIYTFQPAFHTQAGITYVIKASTLLAGDQNPLNDAVIDTVQFSVGTETITGNAEICGGSPATAGLKANLTDSSDAVSWYDSKDATTPIATGPKATTTVIPADNTYWLGLNEISGSVGPKNKKAFISGGYNYFQGNFIKFHNDVPVTIESTRLYLSSGGKINFIVADLASYDSCAGSFSYFPISSTTIDVYPTTPNISRTPQTINSALDTGAVFLLNLSVPTPGDHILITVADDSAFIFRNNNIGSKPYPIGLPGVFMITGNSAINTSNCKDTAFYQGYYYFFYDMKISLNKCASPRVPVHAVTPAPATITRVASKLVSNYASGNNWYFGDSLIASNHTDTLQLTAPGSYKVVVNDSTGCVLVSNVYVYSKDNDIGFAVSPNPNHGSFKVEFYKEQQANVGLRVLDINGKELYMAQYPAFKGYFGQQLNLGVMAKGVYIVQLDVDSKKYLKKMIVY